jgi:hypothetical protein
MTMTMSLWRLATGIGSVLQLSKDEVAARARIKYLQRHGSQGDALGDWIEAECELLHEKWLDLADRSVPG